MVNPIQGNYLVNYDEIYGILSGNSGPSIDFLVMLVTGLFITLGIYSLISSIFQFVFVDCLKSETFDITWKFIRNSKDGFKVFFLYLVLVAIIIFIFIILLVTMAVPLLVANKESLSGILFIVGLTLLYLLVTLIPVWILSILISDFVVPIMRFENSGMIFAMKKFLKIFVDRKLDFCMFVIIKMIIYGLLGIILGIVISIISLFFKIPEILLSSGSDNLISPVCFTILTIIVSVLLSTPVVTFLRYYSLIMLGTIDKRYSFPEPQNSHTER